MHPHEQVDGVGECIGDGSCPPRPPWGVECCRRALKSDDNVIKCMMTLRLSGELDSEGRSASKRPTDSSSAYNASIKCGNASGSGERGAIAGGLADEL